MRLALVSEVLAEQMNILDGGRAPLVRSIFERRNHEVLLYLVERRTARFEHFPVYAARRVDTSSSTVEIMFLVTFDIVQMATHRG